MNVWVHMVDTQESFKAFRERLSIHCGSHSPRPMSCRMTTNFIHMCHAKAPEHPCHSLAEDYAILIVCLRTEVSVGNKERMARSE